MHRETNLSLALEIVRVGSEIKELIESFQKIKAYFNLQKLATSSSVPGSWPPNWLHGKPIMTNSWSLYFCQILRFLESNPKGKTLVSVVISLSSHDF